MLRAAGLRTIEAASGGEGIALATEQRPDVILLDLRLPDMDGADVAQELGNRTRTADIPVVALTAVLAGESGELLSSRAFAGYLEKPIDVRTFPEQVRRYCATSPPERSA